MFKRYVCNDDSLKPLFFLSLNPILPRLADTVYIGKQSKEARSKEISKKGVWKNAQVEGDKFLHTHFVKSPTLGDISLITM